MRFPHIEFIEEQFVGGTWPHRTLSFELEDRCLVVWCYPNGCYSIRSRKAGALQNLDINLSEATMQILYVALKKVFETDEEGVYDAFGWYEGDFEIPRSVRQARLERAGSMVD